MHKSLPIISSILAKINKSKPKKFFEPLMKFGASFEPFSLLET